MQLRKLFPIFAMAAALFAISVYAAPRKHANRAAKSTTITGCLAKGDTANEYKLTANGKTYKLMPSGSVNLANHVGHKVSVTGTKGEASAAKSSSSSSTSGSTSSTTTSSTSSDNNEITVTNIKHISDTCQP